MTNKKQIVHKPTKKGLSITNLSVQTKDGVTLLKNLSVNFSDNKIYGLIGPNGSGKSTLVNTIMGHPNLIVTEGKIELDGVNITNYTPDKRAKLGLFLALQYPVEITGVSFADFIKTARANLPADNRNFLEVLTDLNNDALAVNFKKFSYERDLNAGYSGGEKKKSEILQMLALRPRFALLDEPDSGLDQNSVHALATRLKAINYPTSLIIISHNDRLLAELSPDELINIEELK